MQCFDCCSVDSWVDYHEDHLVLLHYVTSCHAVCITDGHFPFSVKVLHLLSKETVCILPKHTSQTVNHIKDIIWGDHIFCVSRKEVKAVIYYDFSQIIGLKKSLRGIKFTELE